MNISELRDALCKPERVAANSFGILRELCALVNAAGTEEVDRRVQDLVLRALEQRAAFGQSQIILDGLVRRLGLFPYLEERDLGIADMIAYEYHRPANMDHDGIIFHRIQAEVYRYLLDGQNVILSAPTSFGKSLIIDAMIATGTYSHVAIVVPTIALIDETRRRLTRRFGSSYKIITHPSQARGERELLIMTQERILELPEFGPIDFFVIDEFYKLQPRNEDTERSLVLNQAFYRLYKTGAQFYLLGPNIEAISNLPERITYQFIKTDYTTVVSQLHPINPGDDDLGELVRLCKKLREPTLIFCRSPKRVRDVVDALLEGGVEVPTEEVRDAVAWLGEQYHPEWSFARALEHGIGMHHGQLPRTLSQYVVKAFNDGTLQFLVCTSTLIEGVNTKAKNVIVLDNKIANRKYDFFTYNNIVGRSGRMFHHFIGNVYIFRDPPEERLPRIDFPIFTQPDDAPESLLIQMDEQDLAPPARERIADLLEQADVAVEVLRESRGHDPRAILRLAQAIRTNAEVWGPMLRWNGQPTYQKLQFVCNLIWNYLLPDRRRRAGISSGDQLAYHIERLRQNQGAQGLLREMIQQPGDPGENVEGAIDFLRYWANFNFPKYLLTIDRVQRDALGRLRLPFGNYEYFAGLVENWFLDPAIMTLDEYGVPIQVGVKIQEMLRPNGNLDIALERLRALNVDDLPLSAFEKELVRDAIAFL